MRHLFWVTCTFLVLCLGCKSGEVVERKTARWIEIKHQPVEEVKTGSRAVIQIEVASKGVKQTQAFLSYKAGEATFNIEPMEPIETNGYYATIPSQPRGTNVEYYIEVRGDSDLIARLPRDGGGFHLVYEGIPNRALLIAHVLLMFLSLALLLLVGLLSLRAFKKRQIALHVPRLALLATGVFFIASFVLGAVVAYQTYGKAWAGFPIGNDITDNKSLAIFLYFLISTILYKGSALRQDPSLDALPIRTIPYVYLVGVLLSVILFAIPH